IHALHDLVRPADHQAVAALEAPDAAGRADVDVVDPVLGADLGAADVVLEVRVAAVDDRVALVEHLAQPGDGVLRGLARGHHDPDVARPLEPADEVLDRVGPDGALAGQLLHGLRRAVPDDALVT